MRFGHMPMGIGLSRSGLSERSRSRKATSRFVGSPQTVRNLVGA
jgi:hypothetical protein